VKINKKNHVIYELSKLTFSLHLKLTLHICFFSFHTKHRNNGLLCAYHKLAHRCSGRCQMFDSSKICRSASVQGGPQKV